MRTSFAPGRVTLMGDHTDYMGGRSLAIAIEYGTTARFTPLASETLTVCSPPFFEPFSLALPIQGQATNTPSKAMVESLVTTIANQRCGGRLEISSTLPIGAGLSSSASFVIAVALALGSDEQGISLARRCQEAEVQAGADVGLLDQLCILFARPDSAVRIDFEDLSIDLVGVNPAWLFTALHTGISRSLVDAPYGERRRECEEATKILGPLPGTSLDLLPQLHNPVLAARTRHVITESARVDMMIEALDNDDQLMAGALMNESHRSLSEDFAVSLPSIDSLVDAVNNVPGVFGCRLSGAGFGGCLIVLHDSNVDLSGFGSHWRCKASGCARVVPSS